MPAAHLGSENRCMPMNASNIQKYRVDNSTFDLPTYAYAYVLLIFMGYCNHLAHPRTDNEYLLFY